ncbi:hypothetical protein Cni_G08996 [Canna indica]|uniref:ARM repeat superfamily protein n=1 Tax=Canna indica TaxID=4628 RepID=A0AAQ3Q8X6_9LILI|nr:hypothetical protein Cni_G08996 [Canna indica]
MGFISRKLIPACGNMCVCCPALNPSSRRPVKRYKKLLAEVFPKNLDGPVNERKIMKLCEYAAKNPLRIPKISKYLEQRSHKELRNEHINFVKIITEVYNKLLYICKEQMAYFAINLLNVIIEFLDSKQQDDIMILGCQTLTKFICSQADNTYTWNIESLVPKVCMLAHGDGEEQKSVLRAASLQCLSAMIWFMKEHSYIFASFDEIIYAILENYQIGDRNDDETRESNHNWVDEVVRGEARGVMTMMGNVSPCDAVVRRRPEVKDSALLTREERESPEVWSQICIEKLAELANESITMRRVLEPMFAYFDKGRHWASRHGFALVVLSDLAHLGKNSENEQLILAAIIRHLDHKNIMHDPQIKSDIVQIATSFVRQLKSRVVVAEIGVVSDLCRHLRKSLQATVESVGLQESNWNDSLQNSIEDCLLEIIKGIGDVHMVFDMMATTLEKLLSITLEKLMATAVVARATIRSLLILAHIISLASSDTRPQAFPDALLAQLLKTMMHPDVETRVGAHQIFSVLLGQNPNHPRHESEYLFETKKWQSRTTSVFESATALLEKLRKEKEGLNGDRKGADADNCTKTTNVVDEEWKHSWAQQNIPYFSKLSSSVIDRVATSTSSLNKDMGIIGLTEDQTTQLISAFWIQASRADNKPLDFQAIAHSFSLTLLASHLKNSNGSSMVHSFHMLLSLRKLSMEPNGLLPPSCQRSLFTMATGLLAFAGKIFHITGLNDLLKASMLSEIDPYLRIDEDFQIYTRPQSDMNNYGSENDQQAANSSMSNLRNIVEHSDLQFLDASVSGLSALVDVEKDVLAKQLTESFLPEDAPLFGLEPALDWVGGQAFASDESVSFDEECSRSSSVNGDAVSQSPVTDVPGFISRMPSQSLSNVISVGQLLESALHVAGQVAGTSVSTSPLPYGIMAGQCEALGMGTRRKLSSWLVGNHDSMSDSPSPNVHADEQKAIQKVNAYRIEQASAAMEPWLALRLPPASPFDNFLKAAGC